MAKAPLLRPMLAGEFDADKAVFPMYVSPKLDGIRVLIKDHSAMSRTMKEIPNKFVQSLCGHPWLQGLDGEIIVGESNDFNAMQATTSGVMSVEGEPDFTLWVFDVWNCPDDRYELRLQMLERHMPGITERFPRVKLLPQKLVYNVEQLEAFEVECLEQGFEGVMARVPHAPYKYGRSTANQGYLLKLKRFVDAEALIIGFEEQMYNANKPKKNELGYVQRSSHKENMLPKGTLGAFILKDLQGDQATFRCGTGKGLTAKLRQEIWDNRDQYLNKIAKYKFQDIGVKDAPRIPVWVGVRDPRDM